MATPEKSLTVYQVNYAYALNGRLRNGALVINAPSLQQAEQAARERLQKEHDIFRITSTKQFGG